MDWGSLYRDLITLFVVIDPIGTIPIFIAVTAGMAPENRPKVALIGVLIAAIVLYTFLILGQLVFEALGLALGSFQIAGGIILFLFALQMIFGPSKPEEELNQAKSISQSAVFPLAMPSIASPGAIMTVIILTDNHGHSVLEQTATAGLLLGVLVFTFVLLLLANPILKLIGTSGASVISRVMGMILSTVAVDAILNGFAVLNVIDLNH
ncbi:MarC family protein [Hirschia baltica]|uniref:UPF0056 inner membrane protein n=1 Tax=Hirschia baltica (strain ATCC 49814 / DSM 5838 / IFAM 1418) TaxID=582402 RepID=C6XRN8_HIRBI|nr:MarC family protein [Hirschia baltica]ACT60648.1 multiple antibiotic resistance (MarC)-related protein [Hirschia baltica ATCC 49814]